MTRIVFNSCQSCQRDSANCRRRKSLFHNFHFKKKWIKVTFANAFSLMSLGHQFFSRIVTCYLFPLPSLVPREHRKLISTTLHRDCVTLITTLKAMLIFFIASYRMNFNRYTLYHSINKEVVYIQPLIPFRPMLFPQIISHEHPNHRCSQLPGLR